jgi:hypothetical protein
VLGKAEAPPAHVEHMSMAGRHGLATTATGLFETDDGARTWRPIAAPRVQTPENLRCGARACVVGDFARRTGWGPVDDRERQEAAAGVDARSVRTLAHCHAAGAPHAFDSHQATLGLPLPSPRPDLRWFRIEARSDGADLVVERRASAGPKRETMHLLGAAPKGQASELFTAAEGVAAVTFPATCYEGCSYSGQGDVSAVWASSGKLGALHHVSFTPAPDSRGSVSAAVLADGSLLASLGENGYRIDAAGHQTTFPLATFDIMPLDLLTLGSQPFALYGGVVLRSLRPPRKGTAWNLGASDGAPTPRYFDPERTFGVGRSEGRAIAWTSIGDRVELASVTGMQPEPTEVFAVDTGELLSRTPLPSCAAGASRGAVRINAAVPDGARVSIDGQTDGPTPPGDLTVRRVVVEAVPGGAACVRAVIATDRDYAPAWQAVVYPEDLTHAVLFHNQDFSEEALACEPR